MRWYLSMCVLGCLHAHIFVVFFNVFILSSLTFGRRCLHSWWLLSVFSAFETLSCAMIITAYPALFDRFHRICVSVCFFLLLLLFFTLPFFLPFLSVTTCVREPQLMMWCLLTACIITCDACYMLVVPACMFLSLTLTRLCVCDFSQSSFFFIYLTVCYMLL